MNEYDITIRINEAGFYVCEAVKVRKDFGTRHVYYNEPFESVPIELSKEEHKMIYKFRSRYPAETAG